jgi:GNAT superfamily N-acetyltransferase
MSETVEFQQINLRAASDHEYKCLGAFKNIMDKEAFPDDPLMPLEEQMQDWKNIPGLIENEAYIGWNSTRTEVIAFGGIFVRHTGDNEHVANFRIEVLPEFRCQGLGRRILNILLPFAKERKRSLLIAWVNDRVPAAAIFLERMGAQPGLAGNVNQLKVSEFDRSLMDRWLRQSENLSTEFEMGLWEGAVPEDHIVETAALIEKLANDQPRDNLEVEDEKITPDFLRQIQQNLTAAGEQMWTLYILDRANQKLVGLTEVSWHPNRPMILNQGFTAVDATYRNKGLGRWLKATMMKKILEERPQVEFIRTRNANSNAPMLKINNEMGFQPYSSIAAWQVKLDQVENYLNERN